METKTMKLFGDPVYPEAAKQLEDCLAHESALDGALMADHQLGYGMPVGGVVRYDNAVSPYGVGVDIACGNKAVRTNILLRDAFPAWPIDLNSYGTSLQTMMKEISEKISFGMGGSNDAPSDHPLFDAAVWTDLGQLDRGLKQKAQRQLGTVGGGNHYVDLLHDDEGYLWVACHFGSRGLGHTICTLFDAMTDKPEVGPGVFDLGTDVGQTYWAAMHLAGEYAYAGRDFVVSKVLSILGVEETFAVHCHHNFAWVEYGKIVVRKGATPLTRDPAFIGGSMGDDSVIVRGKADMTGRDLPEDRYEGVINLEVLDIGALDSAPHGAGRQMSRTAARGKIKTSKVYECSTRDCDFQIPARDYKPGKSQCPTHGEGGRFRRIHLERRVSEGRIDWPTVRAELAARGIAIVGADADEAPGAYKKLSDVLAHHPNIEVLHTLHPVGVVMAGPDVVDPYKD